LNSGNEPTTADGWVTIKPPKKAGHRQEDNVKKINTAIPGATYRPTSKLAVKKGSALKTTNGHTHTTVKTVSPKYINQTNLVLPPPKTNQSGKKVLPPKARTVSINTPPPNDQQTQAKGTSVALDPNPAALNIVAKGSWVKATSFLAKKPVDTEQYIAPTGPNPDSKLKGRKPDKVPLSKALDGFQELPPSSSNSSSSSKLSKSAKKAKKAKAKKVKDENGFFVAQGVLASDQHNTGNQSSSEELCSEENVQDTTGVDNLWDLTDKGKGKKSTAAPAAAPVLPYGHTHHLSYARIASIPNRNMGMEMKVLRIV
jgi:hypothetical protein